MKPAHALFPALAFVAVGLMAFSLTCASAQVTADTQALPKPPFVAPAPEKAEWIVTLVYAQPPGPSDENPSPIIKEIRCGKSGDTRRETTIWSDNSQRDKWFLKNATVERQSNWPKNYVLARLVSLLPNDDFKLSWIDLPYYKGKKTVDGHTCYVYEAPNSISSGNPESNANPPPANDTTTVWIDTQTHLPVQIQNRDLLKKFEFTKTLPDLTMPECFQEELAKLRRIYPDATKN